MNSKEFLSIRKRLNKTQREMAQLLGTSVKAIHSYEQGWRSVPVHAERQAYFLLSCISSAEDEKEPCWVMKKCPAELKNRCPAWEFRVGDMCWFINGTMCEGVVHGNWGDKIKICKSCEAMSSWL
ncbi:helix-turn-helix domain-containing protein [Thermodesulfobacteriota bacterium]